jgi:formate-dependent nitrite reductase membrane component NrfD
VQTALQVGLPSTFFTEPAHWRWYIVFYFFIGGIAGGSLFLAALLRVFGAPIDRPIIRLGSYIAFVGAILSGILLIVDLDVPSRFWHMLIQNQTLRPMFKSWSPISFGAWGLMGFGLFAALAAAGAAHEDGTLRWRALRPLVARPVATTIAVLGAVFGFFLAGYTGVLLSVTNRPVWADSSWLGILFIFSAASTAAAALILLGVWRRVAHPASIDWLARFDKGALVLELLALVAFLIALGEVVRHVYLSWWGLLLVVGVVLVGILVPLALGFNVGVPGFRRVRNAPVTAAALVLVGGFVLRMVVILASEAVHVANDRVYMP